MTIWLRILPYIAAVLLVAGALFGVYHHGLSVKDAQWQKRWSDRDASDSKALAVAEVAERAKEQARQQSINKVIQDGQKAIDSATAGAAAARANADRLRGEVDRVASRAASQASNHSCTAAASQAASRAVLVLAELFKRADERSGSLAGYADESRVRGLNCEAAYRGIENGN